MTYKAAQQQECVTAGLQLQLMQQCSLACRSPAAMWHPHMAIHVITDVIIIIIIRVAGCGWGRGGGAEQAADGSICIVQVHQGFVVISTQAPHMQRLLLGSTKQLLQIRFALQTIQLANADGIGGACCLCVCV